MDTFDAAISNLARNSEHLKGECICKECPTYNACAGDAGELLYCVNGQSFHCIHDDLGCICPSCPVADEIGLVHLTFCILGTESAQRYEEQIR